MNFINILLKKMGSTILLGVFLLIIFCSCEKKNVLSSSLTRNEKQDLEYFFRMILFDSPGGAFVLFGSKPLCEIGYFDTSKDIDPPFVRNPAHGWKALQKILQHKSPEHYIFTYRPESREEGGFIVLADIQKTAFVLEENYQIFKEYTGMDFHPLEIVFELDDPQSAFWTKIFSYENHLALGLLFGFGKENALRWSWNIAFQEKKGKAADYLRNHPMLFSTPCIHVKPGTLARHVVRFGRGPEDFEIPHFGMVEGSSKAEIYAREKAKIKKIYHGQDIVETTLRQLFR